MTVAIDTPRIYVASLADYNAGHLHGRWIDLGAGVTYEDVMDEIEEMLSTSKEPIAEEWAIHDYEGFAGLSVSEYEDIAVVVEWAEHIAEYGEAFALWVANDPTYNTDPMEFQDQYRGEWDSLEDFAENLADDLGMFDNVNDTFRTYFDFEAFARDLEIGGDVWTATDSAYSVHVFWGH